MKHSVRPHAFGWAVVKHDHPGGTVVETLDSRNAAVTLAHALEKEKEHSGNTQRKAAHRPS